MPCMSALSQTSARSLRYLSSPRLRASWSEARPPFGAHACGTRHRLSPRWLSARTGFPEDGPRGCFARLAFCFFAKQCRRLSTLRADRSLCRSTGDPEPPECGLAITPAGTAPRSASLACRPDKRPSVSELVTMYLSRGQMSRNCPLYRDPLIDCKLAHSQ